MIDTNCAMCQQQVSGHAKIVKDAIVHPWCELAYLSLHDGRLYQCPMCKCKGRVEDHKRPKYESVEDREATGHLGWFAQPVYRRSLIGYESMSCPVCNGWGYTKTLAEPIKETKTIGWNLDGKSYYAKPPG